MVLNVGHACTPHPECRLDSLRGAARNSGVRKEIRLQWGKDRPRMRRAVMPKATIPDRSPGAEQEW